MGNRKVTNLRFADDLLLIATSFEAARAMLGDLMREAEGYGLEVHESKTKFLWNGHGAGAAVGQTTVQHRHFEVLGEQGSTMYLGRLFASKETTDVERRNHISKVWAKFAIYRGKLTSKFYDVGRKFSFFMQSFSPLCCMVARVGR